MSAVFLKLLRLCSYGLAACSLATVANPSAADADVGRYARLIDDIRDFDRYDNARMNDLIFAGLYSDNPRVVERTIAALHRESAYRRLRRNVDAPAEMQKQFGKLERDLVRMPGLRDFLLDYAKKDIAEHGWKALGDGDMDFHEKNIWKLVPDILVEHFPGDPEVRRLLRAGPADDPSDGDVRHYLVGYLNAGLFVDEEADALRVKLLADQNPLVAGSAARGLAMSASRKGLKAMAQALGRRDEALREIVAAMASYGARAAPHMASLRALGGRERETLSVLQPDVLRLMEQVDRLGAPVAAGAASPRGALPPDAGPLAIDIDGVVIVARRGRSGESRSAPLEVDSNGAPIAINWRGEKKPLSAALQLYDAYSSRSVLDAVFAGLHSDKDAVVERTVAIVGFYASVVARRDWPGYFPPYDERMRKLMDTRTRRLGEVPGLRGFLLSYAKRGMNPASCRARGERRDADMPPWMSSIVALAVYFPGNAEVRDMVLDMGQCLDDAGVDESVLPLLAVGRFRGEAVERRRLAGLTHRDPVRAGWAAQGLGWSLTDAGLTALAAQLSRQDEALADIVAAMACYGSRAAPHLPALRALAGRRGSLPDAAFERIASATAKIAQLAAP